jgi:hypothetical protein
MRWFSTLILGYALTASAAVFDAHQAALSLGVNDTSDHVAQFYGQPAGYLLNGTIYLDRPSTADPVYVVYKFIEKVASIPHELRFGGAFLRVHAPRFRFSPSINR